MGRRAALPGRPPPVEAAREARPRSRRWPRLLVLARRARRPRRRAPRSRRSRTTTCSSTPTAGEGRARRSTSCARSASTALRITRRLARDRAGNEQDAKPGFDGADPAQYPPGAWDRYDTRRPAGPRARHRRELQRHRRPRPTGRPATPAARGHRRRPTSPTPSSSARSSRPSARATTAATARRASTTGRSTNEPNQAGWLTPQWVQRDGRWVEAAPRIYRDAGRRGVDRAAGRPATATTRSSSARLAPKGLRDNRGETRVDRRAALHPPPVLPRRQPPGPRAAPRPSAQGCPTGDQIAAFPAQHPALFRTTGWAHHPYELLLRARPPARRGATG